MDIPCIGFSIIDMPSVDMFYIGSNVVEKKTVAGNEYYLLDADGCQLLDADGYCLTVKG